MRRRSRSASLARFKRASASSLLAATSAALVRAIRRRSSTAQSSANNASANRIAKAVEVQGNGALAILNSNDNASEATRSLLNARAVTRYFPAGSALPRDWCRSITTRCRPHWLAVALQKHSAKAGPAQHRVEKRPGQPDRQVEFSRARRR